MVDGWSSARARPWRARPWRARPSARSRAGSRVRGPRGCRRPRAPRLRAPTPAGPGPRPSRGPARWGSLAPGGWPMCAGDAPARGRCCRSRGASRPARAASRSRLWWPAGRSVNRGCTTRVDGRALSGQFSGSLVREVSLSGWLPVMDQPKRAPAAGRLAGIAAAQQSVVRRADAERSSGEDAGRRPRPATAVLPGSRHDEVVEAVPVDVGGRYRLAQVVEALGPLQDAGAVLRQVAVAARASRPRGDPIEDVHGPLVVVDVAAQVSRRDAHRQVVVAVTVEVSDAQGLPDVVARAGYGRPRRAGPAARTGHGRRSGRRPCRR